MLKRKASGIGQNPLMSPCGKMYVSVILCFSTRPVCVWLWGMWETVINVSGPSCEKDGVRMDSSRFSFEKSVFHSKEKGRDHGRFLFFNEFETCTFDIVDGIVIHLIVTHPFLHQVEVVHGVTAMLFSFFGLGTLLCGV